MISKDKTEKALTAAKFRLAEIDQAYQYWDEPSYIRDTSLTYRAQAQEGKKLLDLADVERANIAALNLALAILDADEQA